MLGSLKNFDNVVLCYARIELRKRLTVSGCEQRQVMMAEAPFVAVI